MTRVARVNDQNTPGAWGLSKSASEVVALADFMVERVLLDGGDEKKPPRSVKRTMIGRGSIGTVISVSRVHPVVVTVRVALWTGDGEDAGAADIAFPERLFSVLFARVLVGNGGVPVMRVVS